MPGGGFPRPVDDGGDGRINVLPLSQDLFNLAYNRHLLAEKGFTAPPKIFDVIMSMAKALNDPAQQVYGFAGRGLKNANMVLYDNIPLGWDQESVTPDGKKLLTDTPAAIEAGTWCQKIIREYRLPGKIRTAARHPSPVGPSAGFARPSTAPARHRLFGPPPFGRAVRCCLTRCPAGE